MTEGHEIDFTCFLVRASDVAGRYLNRDDTPTEGDRWDRIRVMVAAREIIETLLRSMGLR